MKKGDTVDDVVETRRISRSYSHEITTTHNP